MKEYLYQVEQRWEKQRQPVNCDQRQYRRAIVSQDEIDLDASSFLGKFTSHYPNRCSYLTEEKFID